MLRVFDLYAKVHSAPAAFHLKAVPFCRNAGVKQKRVVLRADSQNVLGDRVVVPSGGSAKPRDARVSGAGRECGVGGLSYRVRLALADFGLVVVGRRNRSLAVFKGLVAVSHQGFGDYAPALGVVEDSCVFFYSGVVDNRCHYLARGFDEGRRAKHKAVRSGKLFLYCLHAFAGLFFRRGAAHYRPNLRVKVNLAFFHCVCSVNSSVFGHGPNEPFSVPAFFLDVLVQSLALFKRPVAFFFLSKAAGNVGVCRKAKAQLEGDEQRLALVAQLKAVVPVGEQAAGKAVGAHSLKVEQKRLL